jgi:AraC-like DNA-binding protein
MNRTRIVQGGSAASRWELALRNPSPALRPYLRSYAGYTEESRAPIRRLEFPAPKVVVIFEFGPPIRVFETTGPRRALRYPGGFVAGMDEVVTITDHDGFQRGLEVNLTPIGARLVFGVPMSELAGRVVSFRDLAPREHRSLVERLEEMPDWDARLDLIEEIFGRRIAESRVPIDVVSWAVGRIEERGGSLDIGALARELGYSAKHLIALFRDRVGVPPKLLARLVRFDRLMQELKSGSSPTWVELAAKLGYYDQAHLIRDVRQFTGTTPTKARAQLDDLARAFPG